MYYVDTSAVLKLLVEEAHSNALAAFYDSSASSSWVSSALLRIEVMRAVTCALPAAIPEARDLLRAFDYIGIDEDIVSIAMNEPDRMLRSLDAIHLATMRILENELDALIAYDNRLVTAAINAGFAVISPQDRST
ncbi:MAG: type II toxin-antitoxin system VapC family toxin [Actinobacteria bacterium]|nr:type II toxin-antitoxin system VapC family toxin [Actinomycetota bacterium]MCL5445983.1 type II toxin-antitoxin system VapC family toxin [Actinomycetota bacterium]